MHTSPLIRPVRGAARLRLASLALPLAAGLAACSAPAVPPSAPAPTPTLTTSVSSAVEAGTPSGASATTPSAAPALSPTTAPGTTASSAPAPATSSSKAPGAPATSLETATETSSSTSKSSTSKSSSASNSSSTSKSSEASSSSHSSSNGSATGEGEVKRIAFPNDDFDQEAFALASTEMGDAIDPPKWRPGQPSLPVRVSDRGSMPAPETDDTVYMGCHVSLRNGPEKYPCDVLSRHVDKGDPIVMTTESGTLKYTVTKTRTIPKPEFASDSETWAIVPNRLVFVMCDIVDGTATDNNYVVYAKLVS